jgi:uncharacterized membrane protein
MSRQRYIELDILRTTAILGMVVYHTAYDLQSFYGWNIEVFSGGWKLMQLATASLFLLLVGITSSFSNRHPFKRFLRIGAAALLVSVVTFLIDPETYVRFGILHLIAVSALLVPVLVLVPARLRAWLIVPGILLIFSGPSVSSIPPIPYLLLPLGIRPEHFTTVDYFPLIPWFGVILIGYGMGYLLYNRFANGRMLLVEAKKLRSYEAISWPGRHSLLLYLIHQPVIIGILWILLGKPNF